MAEAPSAAFGVLLEVQTHDSAIAALRHRRSHLPEATARAEAEQRAAAALTRKQAAEAELAGLSRRARTSSSGPSTISTPASPSWTGASTPAR